MPVPMPPELAIHDWPLPYEARLHQRELSAIDLVVIHCTELPDMKMTREYGERVHYPQLGTGNSGHYYIEENGAVHRFVANERVANHTVGYNARSIGIEIPLMSGRYPLLGRQQAPDIRPCRTRRRRSSRYLHCCANCARIFRACTTSPDTRISIDASNLQATIRASCCRAGRIRDRCFRGTKSCRQRGSHASL